MLEFLVSSVYGLQSSCCTYMGLDSLCMGSYDLSLIVVIASLVSSCCASRWCAPQLVESHWSVLACCWSSPALLMTSEHPVSVGLTTDSGAVSRLPWASCGPPPPLMFTLSFPLPPRVIPPRPPPRFPAPWPLPLPPLVCSVFPLAAFVVLSFIAPGLPLLVSLTVSSISSPARCPFPFPPVAPSFCPLVAIAVLSFFAPVLSFPVSSPPLAVPSSNFGKYFGSTPDALRDAGRAERYEGTYFLGESASKRKSW